MDEPDARGGERDESEAERAVAEGEGGRPFGGQEQGRGGLVPQQRPEHVGERDIEGVDDEGRFVVPADAGPSSAPETEARIPILMIPQREGWLPYPSLEIRAILPDASSSFGTATNSHSNSTSTAAATTDALGLLRATAPCEVDWRNVGEVIRVLAGKSAVTLSLDATGPGGGPLVLDAQMSQLGG